MKVDFKNAPSLDMYDTISRVDFSSMGQEASKLNGCFSGWQIAENTLGARNLSLMIMILVKVSGCKCYYGVRNNSATLPWQEI